MRASRCKAMIAAALAIAAPVALPTFAASGDQQLTTATAPNPPASAAALPATVNGHFKGISNLQTKGICQKPYPVLLDIDVVNNQVVNGKILMPDGKTVNPLTGSFTLTTKDGRPAYYFQGRDVTTTVPMSGWFDGLVLKVGSQNNDDSCETGKIWQFEGTARGDH